MPKDVQMLRLLLTVFSVLFFSVNVIAMSYPVNSPPHKIQLPPSPFNSNTMHMVDIGFFYTSDLLDFYSINQINEYVAIQINAANRVLENNDLPIRRRAVFVGEYPVQNDSTRLINDFIFTVYNDEAQSVHTLRQRFGMDYVTILRPHVLDDYCGWAFYDNPYAVMELGGQCTSNTLGAHEWGHNDGADHDIANSASLPLFENGHGYNCAGQGTVMSTSHNWYTRHDFYSSADMFVDGEVCGDRETADVSAMLKRTMLLEGKMGNRMVRPKASSAVNMEVPANEVAEGETLLVTVFLETLSDTITQLNEFRSIEFYTLSNTASSPDDFQGTVSRLKFAQGENKKAIELKINQDQFKEDGESFYIGLRHPEGLTNLSELIEITIKPDIKGANFNFARTLLPVQMGKTAEVVIERQGDITSAVTLELDNFHSWLTLDTHQITFEPSESTQSIVVHNHDDTGTQVGEIYLTSLDKAHVFDSITITSQIAENKSSGSFNKFLCLLVLMLLFIKSNCRVNKH